MCDFKFLVNQSCYVIHTVSDTEFTKTSTSWKWNDPCRALTVVTGSFVW